MKIDGAPRLSFLLAVHNDARFVGATLGSILGQTFGDFELVAVDDASTDGTADLLRSTGDARVRYVRNESNLGQVPSLNRGLKLCRGELVARIDGDDLCEPDRLAAQVKYLADHPDLAGCATWTTEIDENDRVIGGVEPCPDPDYVRWSLCHTNWLYHPSMTLRRAVFEQAGGYDVAYPACEDYELWTRLAAGGHRLGVVPRRLIRYRRRPGSLTATNADNQRRVGRQTATRYIRALIGDPCDEQSVTLMRTLMSWQQLPSAERAAAGEPLDAGSGLITPARAKAMVALMSRIRRATIAHASAAARTAADADVATHFLRRGRALLKDAPRVSAVLATYVARLSHHRLSGVKLLISAARCTAGRWRRRNVTPSGTAPGLPDGR